MTDKAIEPTPLVLQASDGFRLTVMAYSAQGHRKGHLIIAGATGVAQRYYKRFAEFAAQQGVDVWTIDYRGVGLSKPQTLRGFEMNYLDWVRLDLATLLSHVVAQKTGPIWMIGHSYGGHAFGLLPGKEHVQRFATFATGSGWSGWMPPLERLRVWFMWQVIGPLLVRLKGYLAWSLLGMGEDLPRKVFLQWRHWCQWPRYFFDDPQQPLLAHEFAQVTIPIRAINALDDKWAPPASRDAFMAAYSHAQLECITIDPKSISMSSIGHMGYFRPQASALWQETLNWLTRGN